MDKKITIHTFLEDIKKNILAIRIFAILSSLITILFLLFSFNYKYSSYTSIVSTGIDYDNSSISASSPLNLLSNNISGNEMNVFTSNDILSEILKSNQIISEIITKEYILENENKIIILESFYSDKKLQDEYSYYLNKGIKKFLQDNLSIASSLRSSLINISVTTKDPELSYLIINDLVQITKKQLVELRNTNGKNKNNYLKKRIDDIKLDLSIARDKEVKFLQDNRDLSTPTIKRKYDDLRMDVTTLANTYSVLTAEYELNKSKVLSNKEVIEFANKPLISTIPTNSIISVLILLISINIIFSISLVFIRESFNKITN